MNKNDRTQRQPSQNQATQHQAPAALNRAIQRLLRPLVKLLLSFQITYPVVQEWLKKAMVDVAERDFPLADKPQTDTRLSLLTGIHRKDIKRLRGNSATASSPEQSSGQAPEVVSLGVQIAAHWMAHWCDDQGQPRVIPFKHQPDDSPSFEALVEQVAKKDIRARVVLDEWLRLGAVSEVILDGEPQLQLTPGAFIPSKGLDEKAFFLGMNLADHIATTSHNLLLDEAKFERCLYYDGLSPASVEELKQLAAEQGMALLTRLNQRALELKQQDQAGSHTHRINIGLYVFDEDERHEPGR
jgi:hypothetical protein